MTANVVESAARPTGLIRARSYLNRAETSAMIVFNVYALISIGFGGFLGYAVATWTHPIAGILVGAATAAGIDLVQRLAKRDDFPASLIDPRAGGHLWYLPVWALMIIGLILTGMSKLGAFKPAPAALRQDVAQNRIQKPEQNPPQVERKVEPERPANRNPPVVKPARPAFADAVVKKISLDNGSVVIEDEYTTEDATDRGAQTPVKVYEIALEADKAYWMEGTPPFDWSRHGLRIEDVEGHLLVEGKPSVVLGPSRLLFIASRSDNHRVIVNARIPQAGKFALKIEELPAGASVAENERLPPTDVRKQSIKISLKTEPFLSAAIAADCQSAWVAFPKGKLLRYSCPDFAVTDTYELSRQAYTLALSAKGLLCAVVQRVNPERPARPWSDLGTADIHLYDTGSISKENMTLTPGHVIPVGGVIEHLLTSTDAAWLYFLDTQNHKVGRIDLETGQLDKENAKIASGTNAICLTPDGTAIYACAKTNIVQKFDPVTLAIEKTIHLDQGAPNGLQATNTGDVFLKSGDSAWTHIYLINANRDFGEDTAKVMPWANVYQQHSILLSPDQTRLYAACFSLSPSNITSFHVARLPAFYRAQQCGSIRLDGVAARGTLSISRDGRFLFCDRGLILTLEDE